MGGVAWGGRKRDLVTLWNSPSNVLKLSGAQLSGRKIWVSFSSASPGRSCWTPGLGGTNVTSLQTLGKSGLPSPGSSANPGIPLSSAPAEPRSPKPRKHMSDSTTSRCARRLGSQSADRARGAPWTALSASRRPPSSARSSPSSSSISLQPGTEQEAKAGRQRQRQHSRDHVCSRDLLGPRLSVLTWTVAHVVAGLPCCLSVLPMGYRSGREWEWATGFSLTSDLKPVGSGGAEVVVEGLTWTQLSPPSLTSPTLHEELLSWPDGTAYDVPDTYVLEKRTNSLTSEYGWENFLRWTETNHVGGWMVTAAERVIEFLWVLYVYNYTFILILE
jgi:hypothetical protein